LNHEARLTTAETLALQDRVGGYRARVDAELERWLPSSEDEPSRLHAAMRYAVMGGGKRIRPVLIYATGESLDIDLVRLDGAAVAVELMHAYSLVHDDLPAMDDDDLRRGQPTCHKCFDEATAILAGDALQALAYQVLSQHPAISDKHAVSARMIATLAHASGSEGMAGGQAIDLDSVGKLLDLQALENMHRRKTGALFRACVAFAAYNHPQLSDDLLQRLDRYAAAIGLAFQIADDILDVVGDTETLGKTSGADSALNKPTYPSVLTLEGARHRALQMHEEALQSLRGLGEKFDILRQLSAYIVHRNY
jgi:farnesyl diphosphate synthase